MARGRKARRQESKEGAQQGRRVARHSAPPPPSSPPQACPRRGLPGTHTRLGNLLAAATDNATTVYYYQGAVTYQGGTYDWFSLLFPINTDWTVRPWSLITSTFSHSPTNLNHLLFNGLTLWFFAPTIERLVGTRRLILLFLAGGAASGLAQVYLEQAIGGTGGALGASGAIMLLLGILILLFPRQRVALFGIVPVPLWGLGIGYAALDVLGALNPGDGIANFAHLAGLAMGLGYGVYFKQDLKRRGMKWVSR